MLLGGFAFDSNLSKVMHTIIYVVECENCEWNDKITLHLEDRFIWLVFEDGSDYQSDNKIDC